MASPPPLPPTNHPSFASALVQPQVARLRIRLGKRGTVRATLEVTPAGLLAVGGLIAMVLLSVTPVVHAAGRVGARADT